MAKITPVRRFDLRSGEAVFDTFGCDDQGMRALIIDSAALYHNPSEFDLIGGKN